MIMKFKSGRVLVAGIGVLALALAMEGCGDSKEKSSKDDQREAESTTTSTSSSTDSKREGEFLPFRIAFERDGTPVIVDEKGNREVWNKAEFPIQTKALYDLRTFTIAFVQGSCTVLYTNSDGSKTEKKYPSAYCKYKGIPED